jgi:hypothetical protein
MFSGPPSKVQISPLEITVAADSLVTLPPISLCFLDAIGNPTTASSLIWISALGDTEFTVLSGDLQRNVTSGSCVTFDNLQLVTPASGVTHSIVFSSDDVTGNVFLSTFALL